MANMVIRIEKPVWANGLNAHVVQAYRTAEDTSASHHEANTLARRYTGRATHSNVNDAKKAAEWAAEEMISEPFVQRVVIEVKGKTWRIYERE